MAATLLELAHHMGSLQPDALPSPAIGTRLSFRLIYPDTASGYPSSSSSRLTAPDQAQPPRRFLSKDLGSLVLGEGGPGAGAGAGGVGEDRGGADNSHDNGGGGDSYAVPPSSAAAKTLADAKFVVGDYLSVAVLPPDRATGAVAPVSLLAESGRPPARRNGSGLAGAQPPPPGPGGRRDNGFPVGPARGRGRGWRGGLGGREWDGGGGHGRGGRERDHGQSFPEGEWRRGERLPEGPRGGRRGSRW